MSKKIYAVKNGRTVGIFLDWATCNAQVEHFTGAKYKSFSGKDALQNAYDFITGAETAQIETKEESVAIPDVKENSCIAYVDGSYNANTNEYGGGIVIINPDKTIDTHKITDHYAEFTKSHNVAGETMAAVFAIKTAVEKGYKSIQIAYDYRGIECWFAGLCPDKSDEQHWDANTPVAKWYVGKLSEYIDKIDVTFSKVLAHSGVKYNELADSLAKEACGIKHSIH